MREERGGRPEQEEILRRGALKGRANKPISASDVASTLSKYIPSEAVALYVAVLPFLVPKNTALDQQHYGTRWVVAGAIALIAVIYAVGLYRKDRRAKTLTFLWQVAFWKSAAVLIAFTGWVCVVPGSPFNSFSWYSPSLGAVIGLVVGGLLGALAAAFEV